MLFAPFSRRGLTLANRVVMAPMTRCRAIDNVPNALMAEYYGQRASAGLIVTEGTSPSQNGLGYARIPGLYSGAQLRGWQAVTHAVHRRGGKIFVQLMHTGRVTAAANLPRGGETVGPTAVVCPGEMYTDSAGMQPHTPPRAMTERDIYDTVREYVRGAEIAVEAGFDGIELHGANGYLIEQFLNANVNTRGDRYGGSAVNRNRFALDVARACVKAIGAERVGIRLSPFGVFNATGAYPGMEEQYLELAQDLSRLGLVYLHLVDHSSMGAPEVPAAFKAQLRRAFNGVFVASGGFDSARAEQVLAAGEADLVAFGRPFIANPDLVARMQAGLPLATPDQATFYTLGAQGYTDYPAAT
ncbi:MAG: alkene reductase [Betaproteobacteria bacterium]